MIERLFALYARFVVAKPLPVLGLIVLVVLALATFVPQTKLDASADALVLEGDQSLKFFREVGKRYSSEDFLVITFSPNDDLYSDASLATIAALRDELAAFERVSSVVSLLDVPLLESPRIDIAELDQINTLSSPGVDRELVAREMLSSPIYKDLLVSADSSTTAIQVNLRRDQRYIELLERRESLQARLSAGSATEAEKREFDVAYQEFRDYAAEFNARQSKFVAEVRQLLDKYRDDATIYLGGVPMIAADMISFIQSDLIVFGLSILAFMVCILAFIFRRFRWVLLPVSVCLCTIVFMLGLLAYIDWRMSVVSSNFVALLLIVTLSINIHLIVRYRELHGSGDHKPQQQLVRETVRLMFRPCLYTALTTIVAFMSLVVSGIRPVIDFGWMMTLGIVVALTLSFTVLPAVLVLLRKQAPMPSGTTGAFTLRFAAIAERFGKQVYICCLVLFALAVLGISRLEVENRFIDFFDSETEIYQGMELVDAQLGGTIPMEILITTEAIEDDFYVDEEDDDFGDLEEEDDFADDFEGGEEDQVETLWFNRAGLTQIEALHDYLEAQPETGKVMSLATIYKTMRRLLGEGVDDIQLTLAHGSLPDSVSSILLRPYLIDELNETRITVRVKETSKELRRKEFLQRVETDMVEKLGFEADSFEITGMLVLYNNMLQSLYRSQILTIAAVFVAIMFMFIVLFRSLKLAVLGIVPNLLAAGVVLGGMGLAGIPLDMMTITIAAISIGIGVDNTIHYIHRFRQEFPLDKDYVATMYRCHGSIGKAMYYTSCTIIVGFSILALSNFKPSIYFGLLTSLAMLAALLGALLLLPRLIITFKPLGADKASWRSGS